MKIAWMILIIATGAHAGIGWKADGNRSLEWSGENGVIIRFVLDAAPRDPHFEILATPDGRNTVWVGPPDHVWHYGAWFSWKYINGVNFWETNPQTGKQQGHNRIEEAVIHAEPDGKSASIRYRELAFPDAAEPAVLEDSVEIEILSPADGRGPQVTWSITTRALADVVLSRTPIAGEPNGRAWGGYAGFAWRGAKDFQDVVFTDGRGREAMDIHGRRARWVNVVGTLRQKPAGVLIIDHPENQGHPATWYITNQPKHPFWFANSAPLFSKEITLAKGESLQHAYRIIVHDGGLSQSALIQAGVDFNLPGRAGR